MATTPQTADPVTDNIVLQILKGEAEHGEDLGALQKGMDLMLPKT